jgi:hypothetical protein
MIFVPQDEILRMDLHGMIKEEVNMELTRILDNIPPHIKALDLVHGFNRGEILLKFVRREFKHKNIKKIELDGNEGHTYYMLK